MSQWSRTRLYAVLGVVGLAAGLLAVGFVFAVNAMLTGASTTKSRFPASADRPGFNLSRPGEVTTQDFPDLVLPPSTALGPAGVRSGFPRTPEGALAQLAVIDQVALQSGSVPGVQAVIGEWSLPGGPTSESWSGVRAMAEFLTSADLPATGSLDLAISASPVLGRIETGDPVVACVAFVVSATLSSTARTAVADCQRMTWLAGRWMIAEGAEPEQLESVWPGTEAAFNAGWRELVHD